MQILVYVRARVRRRDLAHANLQPLLRPQRRILALDVPGGDQATQASDLRQQGPNHLPDRPQLVLGRRGH